MFNRGRKPYKKLKDDEPKPSGRLLTDEEIAKVVEEWVNEDWSVRSIQLDRGHWEYIGTVIAKTQLALDEARIEALIDWGDEDCPHVNQGTIKHTLKRECRTCWRAIKSTHLKEDK